ncbi:hypothetical protein SeLEV6574_g01211 [Synchytrium endobioticum]|uniref:Uncharacterized protein n=1 Tax=Synchytrium endobioticum TaxID=286115 RepID=A0A507DGG0_9FUNG|nr:hypothetical protein SeLEV6574_g01211 [Synchytrium endobioticum]
MATTTACPLKATAVMCLLWMVFLSTSAVGNSEKPNLDEEEAAFEMTGAYANGRRLLVNEDKFVDFRAHVMHMTAVHLSQPRAKVEATCPFGRREEFEGHPNICNEGEVSLDLQYVTYELEQAFETLLQKFANGAHLEEPDMATIRRIIVNEKNLWS